MSRFALRAWKLFDDDPKYKSGRLWRAGWQGTCITNLSLMEEVSIRSFLHDIPSSDIHFSICRNSISECDDDDEHDEYTYREICVWVRKAEDHARLAKIIEGFSERVMEFQVLSEDDTCWRKNSAMLKKRGVNFHVFKTKNKRYLSIEDCPEAALMYLIYG